VHVRFRLSIRDEEAAARGVVVGAAGVTYTQARLASSMTPQFAYTVHGTAAPLPFSKSQPPQRRLVEQPCDFRVRLPSTTPLATIGRQIAQRHGPLNSLILTRKPTDTQSLPLHLTLRELDLFDTSTTAASAAAAVANGTVAATTSAAPAVNRLDAERELWYDFEPAHAQISPLLLSDPSLYLPDPKAAAAAAAAAASAAKTATKDVKTAN
jgi:hypothetical protein